MWLVVIGVVLLGLKMAAFGPVADWSWWWVPVPFVAALLWWHLADRLGWTTRAAQRRDKQRLERRRVARMTSMDRHPMQARFGDSQFDTRVSVDAIGRAGPVTLPQELPRTGSDRP